MHFVGSADLWIHTVKNHLASMSWDAFTTSVCYRFDKDEHNHLLRAFFRIKQSTTVTEYIEQFSDILHQSLVHDPSLPSSVITNRFVDGLKKEICVVIMVHRPKDLDTASSLALLQEEALMDSSVRDMKKWDHSDNAKRYSGSGSKSNEYSRQQSGYFPVKPVMHTQDDKKGAEQNKGKASEDKLSTLKNYRRAKGLCFKCGENGVMAISAHQQSLCMPWRKFGNSLLKMTLIYRCQRVMIKTLVMS